MRYVDVVACLRFVLYIKNCSERFILLNNRSLSRLDEPSEEEWKGYMSAEDRDKVLLPSR